MLIISETEGEGRGRARRKELFSHMEVWPGPPCVSSVTNLGPWRGWCGVWSPADSWQCSGNLQRRIRRRSQCATSSGSAGRTCVWPGVRCSLWTRKPPAWVWGKQWRNKKWWWRWHWSRWSLRALERDLIGHYFTHSPSAIHSISSTCPLNTILELEEPDGMRNVGRLSSIGSSMDRIRMMKREDKRKGSRKKTFQYFFLYIYINLNQTHLLCDVRKSLN